MSEVEDLKAKIAKAKGGIKAVKELSQMDKDNIGPLLINLDNVLKELPKERDRLDDCIKELKTLDADIKAYNQNQGHAGNIALGVRKQSEAVAKKTKSKFLLDLIDAAQRVEDLKALKRD